MKRDEKLRLMLAHRAAAAALEADLKNEAAEEYAEHGARVSWEWAGAGSVIASLNHDTVIVTDQDAFLDWLAADSPHQVRPRTGWEVINPKWLAEVYLPGLVPQEEYDDLDAIAEPRPGDRRSVMCPDSGALVPGVRWVRGGGLRSVAIKADPAAMRQLNLAAATYALGRGPMPGLTTGA